MMLYRGILPALCVSVSLLASCNQQTRSVSPTPSSTVGERGASETPANAVDSSPSSTSSTSSTAPTGGRPVDSGDEAGGDEVVAAGGSQEAADGELVEVVFEDIQLPIQQDMVFRPFMLTNRARELDGRRIRIHGYMLPDSRTKGIKQFVLLKNTECKFGPGGQADHLLNVLMADGVTATYRDDPISVEGTLKVNPFEGPDGNTWSIYDLTCDRVIRYRPRR